MKNEVKDINKLKKIGLYLAYFIIVWDLIEGFIAITAGIMANSIALIGFGMDSGIEVFAALVTVWYLRSKDERHYKSALRLIAVTFFILAAYVLFNSISDLVTQDKALPSMLGILMNMVALPVMVVTAIWQKRTGKALNNKVLIAQSNETWLSNYLSISLLVGLGANMLFGWWWADPLIAIVLAGVAVYEGKEAWEEASEGENDE